MQKKLNLPNFFLYLFYKLKFFRHNKKIFQNTKKNVKNIILIEINNFYPNHILYSYLSNLLSQKYEAQIVGYQPNRANSITKKFKSFLLRCIPLSRVSIYKSFGLKEFLNLNDFKYNIDSNKIKRQYNLIIKEINYKKILNLKLENIYIGDLLYDDFLRKHLVGRVDLNDKVFLNHLYEFIKTFYLWLYYFKKKKVKSIILSHDVYEYALPLRIAQNFLIPSYIPDPYRLFCFNKKKNYTLDQQMQKEINNSLTANEKRYLLQIAKKKMKKKFSSKNNFIEFSEKNIITRDIKSFLRNHKNFFETKKTNILVACHCFYDAPHAFGNFFYDDFVDWLENLGKISEKTNYNWYLKKHPHSLNHNLANKILGNFIYKYKKFKIIPEDIDNRSLKNYVDIVLTVHGSVAFEMAYLNKPVILASKPDHLKNFNFCIKPKNKFDYENILSDLEKIKIKINKNDIFKFYYLNYICTYDFAKISDAKKALKSQYFTPSIFNYWIKSISNSKNVFVVDELKNFINSNNTILWNKNLTLNKF